MTTYISSTYQFFLRRMALCLAALICFALGAVAQVTVVTSEAPLPDANGVYQISKPEHLKWIQENSGRWNLKYKQTANIDFGGKSLGGMIGGGAKGGAGVAFVGTYDGGGHTITGLKIVWKNETAISFGLFGYVTGTLKNIVIDGANIVRDNSLLNTGAEYKVGVLAGAIGPGADIQNIIIKNSTIELKNDPVQAIKAAFVGGVIGDITNGFGGTNVIHLTGAKNVVLRNIFADVDIELPKVNSVNDKNQFNVGGIIGRLRLGLQKHLGENIIYTGKINAPLAMIGPIFGASRADNSSDATAMKAHFAGQVTDATYNGKNDGTARNYYELIDSADFNKEHFFYDFQLYDNGSYSQITNEYPNNSYTVKREYTQFGGEKLTTTRSNTVRVLKSDLTSFSNADAEGMRAYQGVNAGAYTNNVWSIVSAFNKEEENLVSPFIWKYDEGTMKMLERKYDVTISQNGNDFTLTVKDNNGEDVTNLFSYNWYSVSPGGVEAKLGNTEGPSGAFLACFENIRVKLCKKDTETEIGSMGIGEMDVTPSFKINISENMPYEISFTKVDGTPLSDDIKFVTVHTNTETNEQIGETYNNDKNNSSFTLPLDTVPNRIEVTASFNGLSTPFVYELDYVKSIGISFSAEFSSQASVKLLGKDNTELTLSTNVDYKWRLRQGMATDKGTNTIEDVSSTTTFSDRFDLTFASDMTFFVTAFVNSKELRTDSISFPHLTASISDPVDDTYQLIYKNGEIDIPYDASDESFNYFTYVWSNIGDFIGAVYNKQKSTITVNNHSMKTRTLVVTVTDKYGQSQTVEKNIIDARSVTVTRDGDVFTATLHGDDASNGTWEWRGINGDIADDVLGQGEVLTSTTNELHIEPGVNDNYSVYCAVWRGDDGSVIAGYWQKDKKIVYVYNREYTKTLSGRYGTILAKYPQGDDRNDGHTPYNAVLTMKRAYELLNEGTAAEKNIICVMGYVDDAEFLAHGKQSDYNKNATITGTYGEIADGMVKVYGDSRNPLGLGGSTIFKDITFRGNDSGDGILFFYCNLNDITFGSNVKMQDYADMNASEQGLPKGTKVPSITLIGGMHNYAQTTLPDYPSGNATEGVTTITIQSGSLGRLIASARNDGKVAASHNCFGTPDKPHRVIVNVAIKHSVGLDGSENIHDYTPGKSYTHDIGLLVGGQTDGSVYADARLNMLSGSVALFIAGNISYGRPMAETTNGAITNPFPDDGFYGSTVFTLDGGVITDLVGGTLGRHRDKGEQCNAYFYGRSIININGGTIKSNIYGAGAGGVMGLGDDANHTLDPFIPYKDGGVLKYGGYANAKGKMPTMALKSGETVETLNLANSYTEVNINGGTINGNIYGGGFGYSEHVPTGKVLSQAGNLYGKSYVTISGGTVKGNVYGGGAGSDEYYKMATDSIKKYQGKGNLELVEYWNGKAEAFKKLASLYGETNVKIDGGIIEGKVFAGSQGIEGFPDMATVTGNTNVTVENVELSDNTVQMPLINNNIYGGSELGRITGNTNVTIDGGAIGNCIFGGSEGIEKDYTENGITYKKTTAYVDGSTYVTITGGSYFTADDTLKISKGKRLYPSDRTFNIYGGGYNNCIVMGNTNVSITKSLLKSHLNLLEGRKFEECVKDETYRKFSVYGAGRGQLTDVVGNANLTIDIKGGSVAPATKPNDLANNQQFFMICGGGFAGNVYGNTNVKLSGNVFARQAYGGGMYGRIEGTSNIDILGGSYYNVYGGGLLGDIQKGANITIGNKGTNPELTAANRNLWIYENVYGGNDVGGIVGYRMMGDSEPGALWEDKPGGDNYVMRTYDRSTDKFVENHKYRRHVSDDNYGVNLKIYGGDILGDVFGAGNGNHTGYYVPNGAKSESHDPGSFTRMKYTEGQPYLYRLNMKDGAMATKSLLNEDDKVTWGLYEYRPRVNRVRIHIGGNSETDMVRIHGDVYGGGHACTIGSFNPTKDVLTDPSRFEGGGSLKVNFGSNVLVKGGVYMGSRGRIIGEQTVVDNDPNTLSSDMDYHYYSNTENGVPVYKLGFPNSVEGRNRFHAYMKLIDMDAKVQLTFYDDPDATDPTDLKDYDPDTFDAKNIRWGSFFAGGARGSMTYEPNEKVVATDKLPEGNAYITPYEYTLPEGLTIELRAVGGSEDAQIKYYAYKKVGDNEYAAIDYTKPIFTYDGGIVYDVNDGVNGFGGGVVQWHDDSFNESGDNTKDEAKDKLVGANTPREKRVVMRLTVNCAFDPQIVSGVNESYEDVKDDPNEEEIFDQYYGGLVYGGCYNSGITNGSVELICTNNLLGNNFTFDDFHDYLTWSSLRYNIGRVYGGGFGEHSSIWGETHVMLDGNFRGFNVFGGGMQGHVTFGTHIMVKGLSLVYNAIYGGGMRGHIGYDPLKKDMSDDALGTHIRLISGGVDRVYGGAFMGDIYGGTHIKVSDADQPEGTPRLMIGSIFGGNDVTGKVNKDAETKLSANILVEEEARVDKSSYPLSKKETGTDKYYGGFPLVGTIYGGGNGNMSDYIKGVDIDRGNHEYRTGKIHIATGHGSNYRVWDFENLSDEDAEYKKLPDLESASVTVKGGTIINLYGGGSMCTTTESTKINIDYKNSEACAAYVTANQDPMTWGVLRLFKDLQQHEVTTVDGENTRFSYQIYRVFGGNNLMDMDIQPTWDLKKGNIFSVYSGGNFGKMTYCRDNLEEPIDMTKPRGLSLTINSPHIRIASIYGGGRVGDIDARKETVDPETGEVTYPSVTFNNDNPETDEDEGEYGATLNIMDGVIGDVYGGNNVAGTVYNGTNVNITGAISGNVYGSGNGNYIYYYNWNDEDNVLGEDLVDKTMISEGYNEDYGGRFFVLPKKIAYGDKYYGGTNVEKILAINSYRPNVEKAFLNICGTSSSPVHVLGNVYCGGNSSTVLFDPKNIKTDGGKEIVGDIKFTIGDYVTLGGVFLGSNGEGLVNGDNITNLGNLNDIATTDWGSANTIVTDFGAKVDAMHFNDKAAYETDLYPNLLSLYMRAAEVTAVPSKFSLAEGAQHAYIGNFCLGGNHGSMMTDKTIDITLPENLVIFGRVVGGCYDARLDIYGATANGGMTKPLAPIVDGEGVIISQPTEKVKLTVKSKFRPWRLLYEGGEPKLVTDRINANGDYVPDDEADGNTKYYYTPGRCNIYGGCFSSGTTVGNVKIDLYSDVLGRYELDGWKKGDDVLDDAGRRIQVDRDLLVNTIAQRKSVYTLTGASYGDRSELIGDVLVRMMPQETTDAATTHPTIATIFGGGHNGLHVGNTTIEVRDGMVFSMLYGGSRAVEKFGSSEIIVGYPKYYRCTESGTYTLDRADDYSKVATAATEITNADGTPIIKKTVKYKEGDIVAANVFEQIIKFNGVDLVDKLDKFELIEKKPSDFSASWDNISINIGDNSTMNDTEAKFYGGGAIYGGCHAINETAVTYSGVNTQLEFDAEHNPGAAGYGGNSTIVIGDNPENITEGTWNSETKKYTREGTGVAEIKDHISIGTACYKLVKLDPVKGNRIGRYKKIVEDGVVKFIHQSSGKPEADAEYYEMQAEGGVFGDGRRTFVQNFRAVDITGYGYADYTPQAAKLINTFQRMDLLSISDCCLQLQGAMDYATNNIDATMYSIARVGEFRMKSSLTGNLEKSVTDTNVAGNMSLDVPRSRNYMGFFSNVHYIGAIHSNVEFGSKYHNESGVEVTSPSYRDFKKSVITTYETTEPETPKYQKSTEVEKAFKKRNLATAANMIGINNGYTLKVQNAYTTSGGGGTGLLKDAEKDVIYYGPIVGVVEVKLLTLTQDEGGGYIYALNKHEKVDGNYTFLEETGNFVFPASIDNSSSGASTRTGEETPTDNYIVDDCYPLGFYSDATHADTEEVHYWYVQGHNYFFNTTLTAYTYNNDINFHLNNDDNLILLSGITPALKESIKVESINWEEHVDNSYKCALTNDLNDDSSIDTRESYQLYLSIDKDPQNNYDLSKDNDNNYTNVGKAFVARIPNGNGTAEKPAYGAGPGNVVQVANNYADYTTDPEHPNPNTPLLGIRLVDTDNDNYTPDFFRDHLERPDKVEIKITSGIGSDKNTYTIYLRIKYIQGPYLSGDLNIENCALPGEYIYANTQNLEMVMDEHLTVTNKKWYLYPKIKGDNATDVYSWDRLDSSTDSKGLPLGKVDVSKYVMAHIAGDVNRLQLPARYYQNDWKVGYSIEVNGQDFPLAEPKDGSNRLTVHNYHRMSTVAKEIKNGTTYGYDLDLDLVGGALVYIEDDKDFEIFTKYVNYCSTIRKDANGDNITRPESDGNGGTKQVDVLIAEVLPGYNPKSYIVGFTNNRTIEGHNDSEDIVYRNVKNPSGADDIRFVLMADVSTSANCEEITEFRGNLNGNGHTIKFGNNYAGTNFIVKNYGTIRDVGFVTNGADDTDKGEGNYTSVVKTNRGTVENVYYYNFPADNPGAVEDYSSIYYATLIGKHEKNEDIDVDQLYNGTADNCYQNTNKANATTTAGVRYRTSDLFHSGQVAYNLNQEYLKARQRSKDDDQKVRETTTVPSYTGAEYSGGDYLYSFYADGDYRYAYLSNDPEHPEGLRSTLNFGVPNYENQYNDESTRHITNLDQAKDNSRWFKDVTLKGDNKIVKRDERGNVVYKADGTPETTNEGYFPIYLYDASGKLAVHSDFIFFGQRLDNSDRRDYYPVHVNNTNRVYRAGGFHGSRADYGFHFNRKAYALHPSLTAIDFTGSTDLTETIDEKETTYFKGWQYHLASDKTHVKQDDESGAEALIKEKGSDLVQLVYYPPVLDLPGGDDAKNMNNVESFDVVSNNDIHDYTKVTKNLLVYTPEVDAEGFSSDANKRLFSKLHYTRMQNWGGTETDQNDIIGHHLELTGHDGDTHFHSYGGLFHLVDLQNFNAPIEFFVIGEETPGTTGRAWIKRQPEFYAKRDNHVDDGFVISNKAWKSLCIPFTANRVWALNSIDYIEKYSRGEISHFYGSDEKTGITHHDYWLRGFVGTENESGSDYAYFARPGKSYIDDGGKKVELFDLGNDQMHGDYRYSSDWFKVSYGDIGYVAAHDDYSKEDAEGNKGILFKDYPYITKNAPYIVAFPGKDYYEFDLSGEFYNEKHGGIDGCHPQEIMYEYTVDQPDDNTNFNQDTKSVRIPISDLYDHVRNTTVANGGKAIVHSGTFMRIAGSDLKENMYALNQTEVTIDGTTFPPGSVFLNCNDFDITEILPFRTYITVANAGGSASPRYVIIGDSRAIDKIDDTFDDEEDEEEEMPQYSGLNIFVKDNCLVITSDRDLAMPIHSVSGLLYRQIEVKGGYNIYRNIDAGVYIVGGKKFMIRKM